MGQTEKGTVLKYIINKDFTLGYACKDFNSGSETMIRQGNAIKGRKREWTMKNRNAYINDISVFCRSAGCGTNDVANDSNVSNKDMFDKARQEAEKQNGSSKIIRKPSNE